MSRRYQHTDVSLPNGETLRVGTHMGPNGELSVRLRLPSDYWHLTWLGRAAEDTAYVGGKTEIVLDRRA